MSSAQQRGRLTTHVLDTATGRPAAGMAIELLRLDGERRELLATVRTNAMAVATRRCCRAAS